MPRKPRAPTHLEPPTRAWFGQIQADYRLESHHIRLLQLAGEAWDRTQEARAILAQQGLVVESRQGPKPHPCVAIERDGRLAFARLLRDLDLDVDPPSGERSGPPSLRSNRGVKFYAG
jgi:phage terminase small subunit